MAQVTLTQADSGKSVDVGPDDLVIVQLAENPTTGYRWAIDALDPDTIAVEGSSYAVPPGAGIGGGGGRTLTLKAVKPGTSRVQLKLWRDWEGDRSVIDRFDFTMRVQD